MAALGSGLDTATGIFKLREDLRAMLLSEDFLTDVAKRQGAVANMEKPATHLIDAAIRMGAQIVSDEPLRLDILGSNFGLERIIHRLRWITTKPRREECKSICLARFLG